MRYRSFRPFLAFMLLACMTMLMSPAPTGATSRSIHQSMQQGRTFRPTGHRSTLPRMASTDTIPQVKGSEHGTVAYRPAPGKRAHLPAPQHVDRVPAPASSNLSLKNTFQGQSENGWQPSDSNGSGGLNNYLETVNEQFEIYSLSGTPQYGTNFNAWFNQSSNPFDPKTAWDKTGKRFLFVVDTGSSLLLSVAQQTNGLGHYCNYSFPTPSGFFADFPKLGVDADGVYLTVNLYWYNIPLSNELFFVNRAQLESCQTAGYTYWTGLTNPDWTPAFAIVPAVQNTNSGGYEYLVNSFPSGACQLTLWTLASNTNLSNATIDTQCYSPPPAAVQKGSSGTIDTGDNRLYQASYVNGLLTLDTVGSYDWGDGNGSVGIVEWFVLNPSSLSVYNQGAFGTPGYWLFFPETIRNYADKMIFIYDASGPTIDPSIWYTNQSLSPVYALANGASYYGESGTARWGDYQSAWLDARPKFNNSVWITGQYAQSTDYWGTWVGRVAP